MRPLRLSLGMKMALSASLLLSASAILISSFFLSPRIDFNLILILLTIVSTSSVFILLSWWFVDRPLRELIAVMSEAPSRDFLVRAPVRAKAQDVIGRLAKSFNRLLERITTLDAFKLETERQLIMAQEELKYKDALEEKNRQIEKANQELDARWREFSLLYDFSQELSATLELEELYNLVEVLIGNRLGFQEFTFLTYEEELQCLVVKVTRGISEEHKIQGMSFRPGEGITGRTFVAQKTNYIPDTSKEPGYLHYKGERREDGSFLSIPLIFKKKVVGVLNMFRKGIDQFTNQEIRLLNTLAVELAISLVNAKLYFRTKELSVRDELTELYNRRHFQEVLPLEIKRAHRFGKPLTLLMIDIDFFKSFNDRYGHLAGDEILKKFVHVVSSHIREVDFMARFGGEEFVIILPNTPKEDGVLVADKIRQFVGGYSFIDGSARPEDRLTISIGLACYPDDGPTIEDLVDAADTALYEAKREGRNQIIVSRRNSSRVSGKSRL